jgi:hypothetical protein
MTQRPCQAPFSANVKDVPARMPWVELRERKVVIAVLKYVLGRIGNRIFWLGILGILVTVGILVDQAWFYCGAISVAATVDRIESKCTVTESGSSIGVDMDCAVAREMVGNPGRNYSLHEDHRTLLLYTAPDGTPMKEWSTISSFEGHELTRGDRLTAVIDRGNYADIRHGASVEEFVDMFAVLFGSIVVMTVGWICRAEGLIRA